MFDKDEFGNNENYSRARTMGRICPANPIYSIHIYQLGAYYNVKNRTVSKVLFRFDKHGYIFLIFFFFFHGITLTKPCNQDVCY